MENTAQEMKGLKTIPKNNNKKKRKTMRTVIESGIVKKG